MGLKAGFLVPVALVALIVLPACRREEHDASLDAARSLYRESIELLKSYTDSAARARDSLHIANAENGYREASEALNYRYPPDTYVHLNEGQNDTLAMLTKRYLDTLEKSRKRLLEATADSVAGQPTNK